MLLSLLMLIIPGTTWIWHAPPPVEITAYVTAYSRQESCHYPGCLNAAGKVPKFGTIACPWKYPLGTKFQIWDWVWECQDRTALRYDGRFDIFAGEGMGAYEDALDFGIQKVRVRIVD